MKIRDIGGLFDGALAIYKSRWQFLLGIAIAPAVLRAIFMYYVPTGHMEPPAGLMLPMLGLFILLVVVTILSAIALVLAISDPMKHTDIVDTYKSAGPYFFPLLWVAILTALCVLGGIILLIVPGIIFAVWFAFSQYVLILEGKHGVDALKASKAYVSGQWFSVFLRILALCVAAWVASFMLGFVLGIATGSKVILDIATALLSAVVTPFSIAYLYLMYKDLSASAVAEEAPAAIASPADPAPEAAV